MANLRGRVTLADVVLVSFVPVVWGLNYIVIKGTLPSFASPAGFNAVRWVIGTTVLLALAIAHRESLWIERRDWGRLAVVVGIGVVGQQVTFITGLALTTAGHSALMLGCSPVMVALASAALRIERVSRRTWGGIALSLLGLTLLVRPGAENLPPTAAWGDLLTLASAACWAVYTLASGPLAVRYPSAGLTAVILAVSTVVLVAIGLPDVRAQNWGALGWAAWGGLLYSAVLTIALGYMVWAVAIRRLGTTRTAILTNLNPVVALVSAWFLLGEHLTAGQGLGAGCVLVGVALTRWRR